MKTTNVSRFNIFACLIAVLAATVLMASPQVLRAQDPGYYDSQQQGDPPSVVGRLSVLQGNVSFQPAGVQDFSAAEINYPLTTGDRLYTDNGARGEVQAGQLSVRLGAQTDFTVTALSDSLAQFGLAQGSVHLRSFSFDQDMATEVDTPNATVSLMSQGDVRVDVSPQDNLTVVTVLQGQAHVDADGVQQTLQQGQSLQVRGMNPSRAQFVGRQRPDDLDRFSGQRDAMYQQAFSSEASYVNPATIGADDLAGYGDWDNSADYGPVWYPRSVSADWAPYSDGHWANISPWGWTWVGAEPWGFAPYHYGRWARFNNRWGWVPGPQVVRPVYSPALVVFVGGPTFSKGGFSITLGGGGVAAWFPLGPREAYHPWYRSSDRYVNRVNVTNIYNRNTVEVRNIYNNRSNVYANAPANYSNRSVATIAVSQRDFGNGRQVRGATVRVDPRQYQNAPVLNRAPVEAAQQPQGGGRPPARALPPRVERPVLETRGSGNPNAPRGPRDGYNGQGNGGRQGDQRGQQPNPAAGQPNREVYGRPAAPDQGAPNGGGYNGRYNNGRGSQPGQPAPATQPGPTPAPAQTPGAVTPGQPGRDGNGRFNNGRPVQQPNQAPADTQVPAQGTRTPPARGQDDGRGNNGRFNGRNPEQQVPATQPAPQTPAPVPNGQNDSARPGPRRQAPDAPVQMQQQPQQQQEQQRQQQLQQQQLQQQQLQQQQVQQRQAQQQEQQRQAQQQEQQRQQQIQQQQLQQQQVQQRQAQQQQDQQRQAQQQEQQRQAQQQQQQQQQVQQQEQQRQQRQAQQQQDQGQQEQQRQQRRQREAQPAPPQAAAPAPPQQAAPAPQPAQQQAHPPQERPQRQPPVARPVTPPDDKKKE